MSPTADNQIKSNLWWNLRCLEFPAKKTDFFYCSSLVDPKERNKNFYIAVVMFLVFSKFSFSIKRSYYHHHLCGDWTTTSSSFRYRWMYPAVRLEDVHFYAVYRSQRSLRLCYWFSLWPLQIYKLVVKLIWKFM